MTKCTARGFSGIGDVIADATIRRRHAVCLTCDLWRGRCTKGHVLQGPLGCPDGKFPPLYGTSAAPQPSRVVVEPPCTSCGVEVKQLTYTEAASALARAMAEWIKAGVPLASTAVYKKRMSVCYKCTFYKHHQCQICRCVCMIKAKLGTSACPHVPPKWD